MSDQRDYRSTVFLPKTDFPMKAGLPKKEPGILARWQDEDIYARTRAARAGREKFILHDGPPYANGDMHIGHALNHILKDMVVRTQTLLGKDAPYVPGWDCHGLPIEWKVEEQYRKKKLNKDDVPAVEFRAECRAYAQAWVDVQREQLKRLGINGDWDNPYLTMDFEAEATIVSELMKFAESGQLYRGSKPVMWSPVEKTALAEAEVEYEDITSTQIDVGFEIVESPIEELIGAHAVVWTTTPWTIPTNQAIAYGANISYSAWRANGKIILTAEELWNDFAERAGTSPWLSEGSGWTLVWVGKGSDLAGTVARHPIYNFLRHSGEGRNPSSPTQGSADGEMDPGLRRGDGEWGRSLEFYARPRPFLDGSDFVTTESGTGLVHMAPDHGEDDFLLCKRHGIEPVFAVDAGGLFRDDWPWLGGNDERRRAVINPNFNAPDGPICTDLKSAGALLSVSTDYQHSYPHSWRSKKKVIFRCTPQWFVPMDKELETKTLRQKAVRAIADTEFVPDKGRKRIGSMVEDRPDWVLSRQRAWGVPITLFVDRKSGQYLNDAQVNARIVAAVRTSGVDAWSDQRAQEYLGDAYKAEDYERVTDILDVWFDSGCTHVFVLESGRWPDLAWPADLYLEGSDQHRGWFQSSLLESCATRGRAPYEAVLTHGFTMDAKGEKMSKSKGNTVSPIKVMEQYGADIIRLWALSVDYTEDHRIGDEILKGVADQYRKIRNTFRYLLGALSDFDETESVDVADMPELERYILALLARLDAKLRQAVADYDFNTYTREIAEFCNEDLSAFLFDIRKDCLYCDAPSDLKRRAYRTVLDTLFHALVRYAAPVLVFTAEEVWATRYPERDSVHLLEWPQVSSEWISEELQGKFRDIRFLHTQLGRKLESARNDKIIGSFMQASIEAELGSQTLLAAINDTDLAELYLVADIQVNKIPYTAGWQGWMNLSVSRTSHHKCGRCWRHLPDVAKDGALCGRCETVVGEMEASA